MSSESLKVCVLCKLSKDLAEFNKRKRSIDGRQNVCRECNKLRSKKYYHDNRDIHKDIVYDRKIIHVQNSKEFVFKYLQTHFCVDCGEKDLVVLDFDHVRGKKHRSISQMVHRGNSIDKIKEEIEKCEVRCANCHRRKTAKDFQYFTYTMGP